MTPRPTDPTQETVAHSEPENPKTGFADLEPTSGGGLLSELWGFLKVTKKWWLAPIIVVLLLVTVLIILGSSSAAPFIYTLF